MLNEKYFVGAETDSRKGKSKHETALHAAGKRKGYFFTSRRQRDVKKFPFFVGADSVRQKSILICSPL